MSRGGRLQVTEVSDDVQYDPHSASPQVSVSLKAGAEGLKLAMWINRTGLDLLAAGQGLSLHEDNGLVVEGTDDVDPQLVRLEINTGL